MKQHSAESTAIPHRHIETEREGERGSGRRATRQPQQMIGWILFAVALVLFVHDPAWAADGPWGRLGRYGACAIGVTLAAGAQFWFGLFLCAVMIVQEIER